MSASSSGNVAVQSGSASQHQQEQGSHHTSQSHPPDRAGVQRLAGSFHQRNRRPAARNDIHGSSINPRRQPQSDHSAVANSSINTAGNAEWNSTRLEGAPLQHPQLPSCLRVRGQPAIITRIAFTCERPPSACRGCSRRLTCTPARVFWFDGDGIAFIVAKIISDCQRHLTMH